MARTTLGKYELIAQLGRGGMALVFLAVDRDTSSYFTKLVVIKKPKEHLAGDAEFMAMLLDEARIAARLNHPNLVQTIEIGEANGTHFLTMEYLEGQPLNRVISGGDVKAFRFMYMRVLVDVLAGIHYAHELADFDGTPLGIVHRDVNPHNVFVTYEGQVKVVDFGIAKAAGRASETRHGFIKGKVAYMAPEQVAGTITGTVVDRRADVFAVGCMLFEAATGQRIWKGKTEVEILKQLVTGDIPFSAKAIDPHVDDELERILARALAGNSEGRYPTALAMQADLERYLADKGDRITPRQVGAYVAELFAENRASVRKVVNEQLSRLSETTSTQSLPRVAQPASGSIRELPQIPEVTTSRSDVVALTTGNPVERSATDHRAIAGPSRRDGKRIAAMIAAPLLAVATAALAVQALRPQGARASGALHNDAPVSVALKATPPETRFSIDNGPPLQNPFTGSFPRDGQQHQISAVAPGYPPKRETVVFSEDVSVRFTLSASPHGK